MATYLVVRIESCTNLGTGLLVHVHNHAILQSTDKSLHVDSVIANVHRPMKVVGGSVFDYFVDQITRGILPCFLYVVCVIVIVRDRLLLFVLEKESKFFFCLAHVDGQALMYLLTDLETNFFFVGDVVRQHRDERFQPFVDQLDVIGSQLAPPFGLEVEEFREKYMVVVTRQFSTSSAGIHLSISGQRGIELRERV
jgi:hypothetical protein